MIKKILLLFPLLLISVLTACQIDGGIIHVGGTVNRVTSEEAEVVQIIHQELFRDIADGIGIRKVDLLTNEVIYQIFLDAEVIVTSHLFEVENGKYAVLGQGFFESDEMGANLYMIDDYLNVVDVLPLGSEMAVMTVFNSIIFQQNGSFYIYYIGLTGFADEARETGQGIFVFNVDTGKSSLIAGTERNFGYLSSLFLTQNQQIVFYTGDDENGFFYYKMLDIATGEVSVIFESEMFFHQTFLVNDYLVLVERVEEEEINRVTLINTVAKVSREINLDGQRIGNIGLTRDGLFLIDGQINRINEEFGIAVYHTYTGELIFEEQIPMIGYEIQGFEIRLVKDDIYKIVYWTFEERIDEVRLSEIGSDLLEQYRDQLIRQFSEDLLEAEGYPILRDLLDTNLAWILRAYHLVIENVESHPVLLRIVSEKE